MDITDKQVSMLTYTIKTNFNSVLPAHRDEKGTDMKWLVLEQWCRQKMDRFSISSLINILQDDDLDHDWRQSFLSEYLRFKNHEDFC